MTLRKHVVALLATFAWLAVASSASAAFPDFTGCPREVANFEGCIDIQNTTAMMSIKGFNVPLGESLEIRGGFKNVEGRGVFVPARGTNGFIGEAVPVPGGLIGIDWIPGTSVLAITELAGDPEDIVFDFDTFSIAVPVKVRLVNIFLGMNCHIGTNSNPVMMNLATTSPGTFEVIPPDVLAITGNVNGDTTYAVPGASRCGLGLGLINALVNAKLRLPSSSGNNTISVTNNIAIRSP